MPGWPKTLPRRVESSPALADLNGDEKLEVVVNGDQTDTLYIWDLMGNPVLPGHIHTHGWSSAPPAIYDLDKDGDLEILSPEGSRLYALNSNGKVLPGWPVTLAGAVNPPAVGDLSADSTIGIAVSTNDSEGHIYLLDVDGDILWTRTTGGYNNIPPVLGDIDRDGSLEVILANLTSKMIYVWHSDGSLMDGWPSYLGYGWYIGGPPALGDVSGDDHLELLVGAYDGKIGHFWCLDWRGNILFHKEIGEIYSPAVIGDIDGDNQSEIIVASADQKLYGFEGDGTNALGFPILTNGGFYSSPAIADVDKDGDVEIVALNSRGEVCIWDLSGSYSADNIEWGMYMHDIYHSGCYGFDPFNAVNEPKGDFYRLPQRIALSQNYPNPFNPSTLIRYHLSAVRGRPSAVTLKIYNVLGQLVSTLVDERQVPGYYSVSWDGRDSLGKEVSSGIYFYRMKAGDFVKTRKMILLK